jgi:hypothetical protein
MFLKYEKRAIFKKKNLNHPYLAENFKKIKISGYILQMQSIKSKFKQKYNIV